MDKLVSIIVPVYKVEKYLNKCVDSILDQSYQNIEVILVDDGSPDNSGKLCDEYVTNQRVKVIHQKNMGLSGARNTGIENSTGDYLMFIDSDDYIDKDMVKYLVKKSFETNTDIVVCDYYDVINEEINKNHYPETEFIVNGKAKFEHLFDEYAVVTVIACNKLYRRNVFDGVRYPVGKINEDEYVIAELLDKADSVCYSLKTLYYYVRQRDTSITNTYNDRLFEYELAFNNRRDFFLQKNMPDMADLTDYENTLLTINKIKEYIQMSDNPDKVLVSDKLHKVEIMINQLAANNHLSIKRNIKVWRYKHLPALYNRKIRKWLDNE